MITLVWVLQHSNENRSIEEWKCIQNYLFYPVLFAPVVPTAKRLNTDYVTNKASQAAAEKAQIIDAIRRERLSLS